MSEFGFLQRAADLINRLPSIIAGGPDWKVASATMMAKYSLC
jgi:hypothetical protein